MNTTYRAKRGKWNIQSTVHKAQTKHNFRKHKRRTVCEVWTVLCFACPVGNLLSFGVWFFCAVCVLCFFLCALHGTMKHFLSYLFTPFRLMRTWGLIQTLSHRHSLNPSIQTLENPYGCACSNLTQIWPSVRLRGKRPLKHFAPQNVRAINSQSELI